MNFQLDHIGYITDDIAKTAESFCLLGYKADVIVDDDTQRTRICFLRKHGDTNIELVEPYEDNKTMMKMLKRGVSPYHTCYVVDDIMAAYEEMLDNDFTPLFQPVAAPAFDGRLICYFWKAEVGFVELVNH
ncbi:MAG: VOC family protein [Prevotella sp.]|nr:VOC family protein [Prevotella sp.]